MKARIRRTRKLGVRRQSASAIPMNRQYTLSQRRLSEKETSVHKLVREKERNIPMPICPQSDPMLMNRSKDQAL